MAATTQTQHRLQAVTADRPATQGHIRITPVAISPVTRRLLDLTQMDLFDDLSRWETPGATVDPS